MGNFSTWYLMGHLNGEVAVRLGDVPALPCEPERQSCSAPLRFDSLPSFSDFSEAIKSCTPLPATLLD